MVCGDEAKRHCRAERDAAAGVIAVQHAAHVVASRGGRNPNIGPLNQAPYCAVCLYPGDIGAATGFASTADACVLGQDEQAIGGLYAVGNDRHSIMGGIYPGPGITIGSGRVLAYLAARHAVARAAGKA